MLSLFFEGGSFLAHASVIGGIAMKSLTLALVLLASSASAQTTTFTFGQVPTGGAYAVLCAPVTSQDDVVAPFGRLCPTGFYGGGGLQIELPFDPLNDGQALTLYSCTQADPLGNRSGPVDIPGNTLDTTYTLVCGDWSGSITYHSINKKVAVGGRTNPYQWRWIQVSGFGDLTLREP